MTPARASSRMFARAARLVLLCAGFAIAGCSAKPTDDDQWLARAEAANSLSDRFIAEGRVPEARDVLRATEERLSTSGNADAHTVRRDLLYRLAEIELSSGNAKAAADWATRGLGLGRPIDAFTTNLLIVRGRASEQMNDAVGASRDYHDALVITEALLDQSLEGRAP
ncbi:MAG TPA: hypothetical protein VHC69_12950 [Polyangiaceae bacterium]|nr:hypothetical protein [Polyangiaceae bacterium]